ncbi:tudor domain-containing protein [Caerostris extrusa]|uniref:RNA helicase n=1 Tax=Caerostris extrusa TaxID=172846 RepID=A0AAV4NPY1_CAEEX|nr:tudor domain-containing protein [Caerostris extrusa]
MRSGSSEFSIFLFCKSQRSTPFSHYSDHCADSAANYKTQNGFKEKFYFSTVFARRRNFHKAAEVSKSPGHFIVKETPGINSSSQANEFLDLEKSMQHFYSSLEPNFFQLPVKTLILSLAHGYMIKVYLLDYGKECNVPRIDVFEIQPDFLRLPVQAVDFKLSALEPMSYVLSNYDLACDLGQIPEWDSSAVTFVEDLLKGKIKVGIKVEGMNKECLFGTLHVTPYGGDVICLNDELVLKKYAAENPNCWNDIIKVNNTASRMDAYSDPCLQNKSSSPESLKTSSASSTITSMSEKVQK